MLFLCDLPVEEETGDKQTLDQASKKKMIILLGVMIGLIVVIGIGVFFIIKANASKNISPYCSLMRDQNRVCKIHNKKHTAKDSELIIPEEEMAFHRQLFDEITAGAYFDGKRLYKKEDAKEILALKSKLSEEKAALFESYLSSSLNEEEKERYNFLIEELEAIEESMDQLDIKQEDAHLPSQEELLDKIARLEQELATTKEASKKPELQEQQPTQQHTQQPTQSTQPTHQIQESILFTMKPSNDIKVPSNIENAATIKKSSLYIS